MLGSSSREGVYFGHDFDVMVEFGRGYDRESAVGGSKDNDDIHQGGRKAAGECVAPLRDIGLAPVASGGPFPADRRPM